VTQLLPLIEAIPPIGGKVGAPLRTPKEVMGDRGYDSDPHRMRLSARGIATAIHYPRPIHLQPAMAEAGGHEGSLPVSEQLSREVLSLPLYPELPANGTDITLLSVIIVDDDGERVPTSDALVTLTLAGDAALFGLAGKDEVMLRAGIGRIVLRAGRTPGAVAVTAESLGLRAGRATVEMRQTSSGAGGAV
jgi:hypothetical protein